MIQLGIRSRSRTKNPTLTPNVVSKSDSDSTKKTLTPYDSASGTLVKTTVLGVSTSFCHRFKIALHSNSKYLVFQRVFR